MIGYVTLGTNDLARAAKFYDALLGEIGGKREMETEQFISWSAGPAAPGSALIKPYDGKARRPATARWSRSHVDSQEKVKALYDKALKLGGKDEGASRASLGHLLRGLLPRSRRQQAQRVSFSPLI